MRSFVFFSLLIHFLTISGSFIYTTFFSSSMDKVLPSIQVDIVDLPSVTKARKKFVDIRKEIAEEVKTPVVEAPDPPKKDDLVLKKKKAKVDVKKKASSALERLKAKMAKKQRREKNRERRKKQKLLAAEEKELAKLEQLRESLRGNKLNQGNSSEGVTEETENAYKAHIRERLQSNWRLPIYVQKLNLSAEIRLYIDASGRATFNYIRPSGNDIFDAAIKEAVESSSPLAPPPSDLLKVFKNQGIMVGFPI